jgi:hypothetical protein
MALVTLEYLLHVSRNFFIPFSVKSVISIFLVFDATARFLGLP